MTTPTENNAAIDAGATAPAAKTAAPAPGGARDEPPALDPLPWTATSLKSGQIRKWTIGALELWIRRLEDEWQVASRRPAVVAAPICRTVTVQEIEPDDLEDGLPWRRWVRHDPDDTLLLVPAMPSRSVVVRPEAPLFLPNREQATFYVSIPVWIRICVGKDAAMLGEEPSLDLSSIWFGDPMEGELCFSLRTSARRHAVPTAPKPYSATCTVTVINRAPGQLGFERLCLRVAHLSTFWANNRLWTNAVTVTYNGDNVAAKVDYTETPPAEALAPSRLTPARAPAEAGFLQRGLSSIRTRLWKEVFA